MSSTIVNVVIYLVAAVASVYLGIALRKWRERSTQEKLIREVVAILKEPLPTYKKGQHSGQINWDRVYNHLKEQPESEKKAKLMKKVDQMQRLHYKSKLKK